MLAGVGGAGVQPVAGAGHRVGHLDALDITGHRLQALDRAIGLGQGRAGLQADVHLELTLGELGDQLAPEPRDQGHGAAEDSQRHHHHGAAMVQRPGQQTGVGVRQGVEEALHVAADEP